LTTLVAPRIVRRIVALARGDSAAVRLARDYAAAYGADLGSLLAEQVRAAPPREEPPPRSISPLAESVRLSIDLAPARAPRSRRAQILRRIARLAPDATVESSGDRLLVTLPARAEAEPLRARLASNLDVAAVGLSDASQLAVSDARVG